MMREATSEDADAIETFLSRHPDSSMYLRENLASHGVGFGEKDHSTRFFLWGRADIEGVFGYTKSGYLMAQMPEMTLEAAQAFLQAIEGTMTRGMTGPVDQVETVLATAGLTGAAYQLLDDEPLYRLDLNDLPSGRDPIRPLTEADLPLVEPWYAEYFVDTNQATSDEAQKLAPDRARADLGTGRVRLLIEAGNPVAMAAINAKAGHHVQVGGVGVPAQYRSRGYGRRVTAALLREAQREGAQVAVLFANNPTAARSYEAIGFRQVDQYRIALLAKPQEIRL